MRLGAMAVTLAAMAAAAEPAPAVDARNPGAQLPAEGRSLFDFVMTEGGRYSVPFPFEALLARLAAHCEPRARGPCVDAVLIPLGRSLQRATAAPDFFRYPRVVAAANGESRARGAGTAMLLRDRLYLGYQEKAGVIEVISYNEAAGRFEFQVVRDYRSGATPRVLYANRVICTACHQNQGPIFPRASWDETNANPRIAALLLRGGGEMHGVAVDRGVDIPNAIDDATDRAAFFSAYQLLWREGCEGSAAPARCRAALFTAVLQYRLGDGGSFDEHAESFQRDFASVFAARWRERWPRGLAIASADIPNRDPLSNDEHRPEVAARFDPLEARLPVETWAGEPQDAQRRLIEGLAGFLAESDARTLDETLFRRGVSKSAARRTLATRCSVTGTLAGSSGVSFTCASGGSPAEALRVSGSLRPDPSKHAHGELRIHWLEGERGFGEMDFGRGRIERRGHEIVVRFTPMRRGRHVRMGNGNAIERITLRLRRAAGEVAVTTIDDFSPAAAAIDEMAGGTMRGELDVFAAKPFRRVAAMEALFTRLGVKERSWCCLESHDLPPARADQPISAATASESQPPLKALYQFCGTCHLGPDRSPPNFLQGDPGRVDANIKQCAQRLYARLAMWELAPEARAKSPMPPPAALAALDRHPADWSRSAELAALRTFAAGLLRTQGGLEPSLAALASRSYESLRPCLDGK